MKFTVASTLLDACVLGVLSGRPTYGYDLTQKIQTTIEVSESTLYPVLRRLLKDGLLSTFDEAFDGRNRRYYQLTENGKNALSGFIADWKEYKGKVDLLMTGGIEDEQN